MQSSRRAVLGEVVDVVTAIVGTEIVRVGIDGIDGAGKTMLADELADVLRERGRSVLRASVDGFHNPRDVRYRRGRYSAVGYLPRLLRLRPAAGRPARPAQSRRPRRYLAAVHDVATDQPVEMEERIATAGSMFVFDGIFLHRPELADYWDCSVFLDVERVVANEWLG